MGQYSSYYLYQKYEKRGDQDWIPCYPNTFSISGDSDITMQLVVKSENDPDCGYVPPPPVILYRWVVVSGYICSNCEPTKALITISADTVSISGSGEITQSDVSGYAASATNVFVANDATSIGDNAFSGFTNMDFVRIPSTVTTIGQKAFYGADLMTECQIPYGTTTIGNSAFTNCTSLMFVDIPSTVTSLGSCCFMNCLNFRYTSIPSSVTEIPTQCFYNCDGLSDIELPSSVSSIGNSAFAECSGLFSVTVLSTTPPTLGTNVFYNTNANLKIYVPCGSVETYRSAPGWSYYGLRIFGLQPCTDPPFTFDGKFMATYSDVTTFILDYIPSPIYPTSALTRTEIESGGQNATEMRTAYIGNLVENIKGSAFISCSGLTSINIPDSVTTISANAFEICTRLSSMDIPNSVTNIEYAAFRNCSGLTSLTIGSGITNVGDEAFRNCSSLTSITIWAETPPVLGYWGTTIPQYTNFDNTNDCPIYVPSGSVDAYKAASGWSKYASRIRPII